MNIDFSLQQGISEWRFTWTDLYPSDYEIDSHRYDRFYFGPSPIYWPPHAPSFLAIPRHDALTKETIAVLLAPVHYYDHIEQILKEISHARKMWLKELCLGDPRHEAQLLGLGTWLRYLDLSRDVIFDEIRASTTLHCSAGAWTDVRLPALEEWVVKHRHLLHATDPLKYNADQLSQFLADTIPAVMPREMQNDFSCRPGTNLSYTARFPSIAKSDKLDLHNEGLGGSFWKRETEKSLAAKSSMCNVFIDPERWCLIQKAGRSVGMERVSIPYADERGASLLEVGIGPLSIEYLNEDLHLVGQSHHTSDLEYAADTRMEGMPTVMEEELDRYTPENHDEMGNWMDDSLGENEVAAVSLASNYANPDSHVEPDLGATAEYLPPTDGMVYH